MVLPQEITQSYGTGVHEEPGLNIGGRIFVVESNHICRPEEDSFGKRSRLLQLRTNFNLYSNPI